MRGGTASACGYGDEVTDTGDLRSKMTDAERHLVHRLVAFFATGDSIGANNLVLNLYQHVNSPEGRLYLSRQLFEEAVHVQFYLTLLDTYVPDETDRSRHLLLVRAYPRVDYSSLTAISDAIEAMREATRQAGIVDAQGRHRESGRLEQRDLVADPLLRARNVLPLKCHVARTPHRAALCPRDSLPACLTPPSPRSSTPPCGSLSRASRT